MRKIILDVLFEEGFIAHNEPDGFNEEFICLVLDKKITDKEEIRKFLHSLF